MSGSRLGFLRRGRTAAVLNREGTNPDDNDLLKIVTREGSTAGSRGMYSLEGIESKGEDVFLEFFIKEETSSQEVGWKVVKGVGAISGKIEKEEKEGPV